VLVRLASVKIVSVVVARDDSDIIDAHLAFHLNAGVDLVLAVDHGAGDATAEILESYTSAGHLQRVPARDGESEGETRTRAARSAVTEHEAEWVLSSDADEFWWPRGESLKDVLAAIPPRYGVVQGLVRVFPPREGEGFFADRMTVRPTLLEPPAGAREPLSSALRPLYRANSELVVDPLEGTQGGRLVPLRAWYPIEVLRFPFRSLDQAKRFCERASSPRSALESDAFIAYREGSFPDWYAKRVGDTGLLAPDERLRDALRRLTGSEAAGSPGRFPLTSPGTEDLGLHAPNIVEDARYAGECAAVGEVDLESLDRQIRELEARIGELEARFWPRVVRTLSRVVRR
jgi:hypothetical protein